MPSFILPDSLYAEDDTTILSGSDVHHITNVLRMGIGDKISLFEKSGNNWTGSIMGFQGNKVEIRLLEKKSIPRKRFNIVLVQAMPRPGKMDFIVEKLSEMGISAIIPILTKRSWKWVSSRSENRLERWRKKAYEATKQSGALLPDLHFPVDLSSYLSNLPKNLRGIIFLENGGNSSIKDVLKNFGNRNEKNENEKIEETIHFVVGPEGGFEPSEIIAFKENGFSPVTLPFPVLRVETASLAALAILIDNVNKEFIHGRK